MDPNHGQEHHQKDFLAFLFPESSSDQQRGHDTQQNDVMNAAAMHGQRPTSGMSNFTGTANPPMFNPPIDLMSMSNLMSMQGMDTTSHPALPNTTGFTPQVIFEQQYKLTQLHQLQQLQNQIQNQIFQQQLALISGQSALNTHDSTGEPSRDQVAAFSGLPTPMSSTELRPLPNPEFLNRISSQYSNTDQGVYSSHTLDPAPLPSPHHDSSVSAQYLRDMRHPGSSSAPANIVFQHTSPSIPLPSPSDLDIDISPLTSPWLEAYHTQRPSNKRTASPSVEEAARAVRKRGPPSIISSGKQSIRHAKSATNTPLLRSTRTRRNSTMLETDSPSPVDLSMPPPAPPAPRQSPPNSTQEGTSPMTPVTPASIMNLGRLGISSSLTPATAPKTQKADKVKELAKVKITPDSGASSKGSKKGSMSLVSPAPKPILPAGTPASLNLGSSAISPPVLNRRSHKDAEQKRRDSLKTAYDDLRVLLPPVPLPSDENFPDEPILPGALPPRGPPKVGGDGPNKGVSKLQLLRCGNDFIRTLKGRVERRDSEIENLRKEVLRLRAITGDAGGENVDLERDLDAVEAYSTFRQTSLGAVAEGDDADDAEE
ncbi:hypothetical protein K503DRAFT_710634 [Rhizopogon vinicolor AM-OR11-026]|uniref:BHLH domain-containing protein n=1 Tax=Rhizopogon vinicolor AM-OR11-026 TaxID=1314800 RepID=A0A1B7NCB2_9AGAM|nr:hypothetical protein K503DRAFT_710634 [Rhizopogon vinicolor AM-OR11-026]